MAEVENLLISIAADTSNLTKGLRSAEGALGRFGRLADNLTTGLRGLIGVAVVQQLSSFATSTLSSVAAIGKLAENVGLTTQQFQQFSLAVDRTGSSNEAVAGSIADFARNLSDLQRGSGRFLQFLREAAPGLVAQFEAAEDVNGALLILADAMSTLGDRHDQLRLAQAAGVGGMQGFVNALARGRGAFAETATEGQRFTDAAIRNAERVQKRWNELWQGITRGAQGAVVALIAPFDRLDQTNFEAVRAEIARLEGVLARGGIAAAGASTKVAELRHQLALLADAAREQEARGPGLSVPPASEWQLQQNAIKAAQGELALYMQRLQALPVQAELSSTAFVAAWEKQLALLRLQGATENEISAARIAMLRQEDAERLRVLGSAVQPYDELIRRQNDLNHAMQTGVIDSEQFGRAMAMAAATSRDAYLSATSAIGQAVARVFEGNKGVAVAAAIIDTLAAANKALAAPPGPPVSYAYVAAALAVGFANVRQILAVNKNSTSTTAAGGGSAPIAPTVAQQQSIHVTGIDPAMIYSGTQFESFMGRLNDATKNGATLISSGSVPA